MLLYDPHPSHPLLAIRERTREHRRANGVSQLSVLDILKNLIGGSKCFGRVRKIKLLWGGSRCSQPLASFYSVLHLCLLFSEASISERATLLPSPNRSARSCCRSWAPEVSRGGGKSIHLCIAITAQMILDQSEKVQNQGFVVFISLIFEITYRIINN